MTKRKTDCNLLLGFNPVWDSLGLQLHRVAALAPLGGLRRREPKKLPKGICRRRRIRAAPLIGRSFCLTCPAKIGPSSRVQWRRKKLEQND
jgi:hypothetical protein